MNYSEWPQWLTMFVLILPVVGWPASRIIGLRLPEKPQSTNNQWSIDYAAKVVNQSVVAWVLYMGGFWG